MKQEVQKQHKTRSTKKHLQKKVLNKVTLPQKHLTNRAAYDKMAVKSNNNLNYVLQKSDYYIKSVNISSFSWMPLIW